MFVSIHIPKTAGTALAKIFDDTSSRRVFYDYVPGRDIVEIRSCPEDVRKNKGFIESYFKYLHGHFHYLRYADVFASSPFITTVRDPVRRVISQYLHIYRSGDRKIKMHQQVMDGEMNIVEFSQRKYIGNAQWHYLEGRPIKDYDFIFVQEHLDESLRKFCARFGRQDISDYLQWMGGVPVVNEKPGGGVPVKKSPPEARRAEREITADDKRRIAENCEQDFEVYRVALETLKSM